jgi:acetyl esterase/lipase
MASVQAQAVQRYWSAVARAGDSAGPAWEDLTAEPDGVEYVGTTVSGLPAMWLLPEERAHDRVLLCLHGGGFVSGSIATHRKLFGHLAKAVGVRGLVFAYHLAPGHTHPAQVDEALDVYRWLLERGVRPEHIAVTGDSCGGGLSMTLQLRAREKGLPLPAAAMPFSPWVDLEVTGDSYTTNRGRDAFFRAELVRELARTYLGPGGDVRDPSANPLHADLTGLPPVYIQAGGDEVLLDDARRLAEHARRAGVEVRLDVFPEMQHTFQMAAGRAPEADAAIAMMAEWVRPKLGLAVSGDHARAR